MRKDKNNLEKAVQFGQSLDNDDFEKTATLLSPDCLYQIGGNCLKVPVDIVNSYKTNMIEGKKKMDKLEWGKSRVEPINENEFYVHFTDYLTHKGEEYTHRCKQKISFGENGLIIKIEHVEDKEEQNRLNDYYRQVGIKISNS